MPNNISITYAEHSQDILEVAVKLIKSGSRCALVTSLTIKGGAAREVGSLAVIAEDGSMTGYLSNGCIDHDIRLHSLEAIETCQIKCIHYGAGSSFMDLKLPCGGSLELVIDPLPNLEILRHALDNLYARKAAKLSFCAKDGLVTDGNGSHCFSYAPKPALVLAGRGAIFRTAASLACEMDFELHLASPDTEDIANIATLNPKSSHHMISPSSDLDLPFDEHTAVLLLFHDHEWEQVLLMKSANASPFFIGALGSKKTQVIRLEQLRNIGLSAELCKKIRGPIGLVPSLRNASLIAISALAEITSQLPASQTKIDH